MSKPVKELIKKELLKRFAGVDSLAVVGFTGLDAIATNKIRGRLRKKQINMTVVKNSIAKRAFDDLGIAKASDMLEGPCAVAYGADSVVTVVRELLEIGKDSPKLTVKAAFLEGEIFPTERIDELSKFPTRDEAIGRVVACILSPGKKLAACIIGPGSKVASILKTIEEKAPKEEPKPAEAAPVAAEAPAAAAAPAAAVEAPAAPAAEIPASPAAEAPKAEPPTA
jgi:large subunit ribosomal protein L10